LGVVGHSTNPKAGGLAGSGGCGSVGYAIDTRQVGDPVAGVADRSRHAQGPPSLDNSEKSPARRIYGEIMDRCVQPALHNDPRSSASSGRRCSGVWVVGGAVGGTVGVFAVGEAWGVGFFGVPGGWGRSVWLVGALVVVGVVGAMCVIGAVVAVSVNVVGGLAGLVVVGGLAGLVVVRVSLGSGSGSGRSGGVGAVVDLEGQVGDAVVAG
jgi:hypothetical protein